MITNTFYLEISNFKFSEMLLSLINFHQNYDLIHSLRLSSLITFINIIIFHENKTNMILRS